jgi:hypothetical protein
MSILFHHYKELKECISEVERIEEEAGRATDSKKKEWLTEKEEKQEEKEEVPTTVNIDGYFIQNHANFK